MAKTVAEYLVQEHSTNSLEFSDKMKGYKIKLLMSTIPEEVARALRFCTRETTSSFGGKKIKVRLLSVDLLSRELDLQLRSLLADEDFDDWVEASIEESVQIMNDLGNEFYQLISR